VVNARGAFLEKGRDDDDAQLLRQLLKRFGRRAGNRLGQFEILVVFALAEVKRAKQFLRANDLRTLPGGPFDKGGRLFEILGRIRRASRLQKAELYHGGLRLHQGFSNVVERETRSSNCVLPLASPGAGVAP
jgi:hypothetical protein